MDKEERDKMERDINTLWKKKPQVTYEYLILKMLMDISDTLDSINEELGYERRRR